MKLLVRVIRRIGGVPMYSEWGEVNLKVEEGYAREIVEFGELGVQLHYEKVGQVEARVENEVKE